MAEQLKENKQFVFTWKIENLNFLRSLYFECLESPKFNIEFLKPTSWYLQLVCVRDSYSLHLYRIWGDYVNMNLSYSVNITDNSGSLLYTSELNNCFRKKNMWKTECSVNILRYLEIRHVKSIIIRCTLIFRQTITNCFYECKALSNIEVEQTSFVWNVENFLSANEESKLFTCSQTAHIKITLSKSEEFVKICLERVPIGISLLHYLICEIALLDINGHEHFSSEDQHLFKSSNNTWNFLNFIKMSDLLRENSEFVKNNTFSLMCKFSISCGAVSNKIEYHDCSKSTDCGSGLTTDSTVS